MEFESVELDEIFGAVISPSGSTLLVNEVPCEVSLSFRVTVVGKTERNRVSFVVTDPSRAPTGDHVWLIPLPEPEQQDLEGRCRFPVLMPGTYMMRLTALPAYRDFRFTIDFDPTATVPAMPDAAPGGCVLPDEGEDLSGLRTLLRQIELAAGNGLYYLALMGALVVPDILAALEAEDGSTNGDRYRAWVRVNLPQYHDWHIDAGALIWGFRCSLLHQGRGTPHKIEDTRILFLEPGSSPVVHGSLRMNDETAITIDVQEFCLDLTNAARRWYRDKGSTPRVQQNLEQFVHRHPEGLSPWFVGMPVYG